MKLFLTLLISFAILSNNAMAQDFNFCEKLNDKKTYAKDSSYKELIEGKNGWVFRTKSDFNTDFKVNSTLEDSLTRLYQGFKSQNIDLVIALLPARGMMHANLVDYPDYNAKEAHDSYLELVGKLRNIGISVAAVEDFSKPQKFYYKRDHHWNAEGAKFMAEKVAYEIKKLPSFAAIEKKTFITEAKDKIDHQGTFSEFIEKTCDTKVPAEQVLDYNTFQKTDANADLFGDEKKPEIVLVGTSNSVKTASHANFDGFIKEYLGADIDNQALTGGGVDSGMLSWLASSGYKSSKPKILVWEFPVYQNFKGSPFYRQAIPAIYEDCKDSAIASDQAEIKNNKLSLFTNIADKKITAKGHYMHLSFEGDVDRKFRLTTNYMDDKSEPFNVRRSKFYEADGTFFLEFDQSSDKTIKDVVGLMPKGSKGKVSARICRYPE